MPYTNLLSAAEDALPVVCHVTLQCHVVVATNRTKLGEHIVNVSEDKGDATLLSNEDIANTVDFEAIDTSSLSQL